MSVELKHGQRLITLNGDYAIVEEVGADFMTVSYKGQTHHREKGIVGTKLFIEVENDEVVEPSAPSIHEVPVPPVHDASNEKIVSSNISVPEKICNNCLEMRSNNCFGRKIVCEDFRPAPVLAKAETEKWPEEADASRFRRTSRRR